MKLVSGSELTGPPHEVAMVTSRSQTIRRRLGSCSVTLTGQGLGLGLGTSLFPVGATEMKGLPWQPSRRIALALAGLIRKETADGQARSCWSEYERTDKAWERGWLIRERAKAIAAKLCYGILRT